MPAPRILAFSGSARKDSFNQRLVTIAANMAGDRGADVTLINLRDYPMPLFNRDDELANGQPDTAAKLKALFAEHDALLMSAPEYNGSITPLLKNTLDWLSRQHGDEPKMVAYNGKYAALLSASPGALGGLRGLVHVRQLLTNLGVTVQAKQFTLKQAGDAFDDDDALKKDTDRAGVEAVVETLVKTAGKLYADR